MKRSQQPFPVLMIMSLFFLLMGPQSCTYKHYKGFEKVTDKELTFPFIFDTSFRKATYTTDFVVAGNHLSGITIFKNANHTNTFHMVFMSQIGLKYFDIEVAMDQEKDWFRVHYMMKNLDREFILDALKTDFGLLLKKHGNKGLERFQNPENGNQEIIARDERQTVSYLLKENDIHTIHALNGKSTVTSIQITEYSSGYPNKIEINNKRARLKMTLIEF